MPEDPDQPRHFPPPGELISQEPDTPPASTGAPEWIREDARFESSDTVPPPENANHPLASWSRRLANAGNDYRLTRFMLLRFTGLVYLVAFLVAAQQFIPLIGEKGLLPAPMMVERVVEQFGSSTAACMKMPSLFWFHCTDATILAVTWSGVVLSLLVLAGFANVPMLLVMWALYLSLLPIGQDFMGYGWDIQMLETGFLAIFLAPLLDPRPFPARPPSVIIIFLYRWLIFRIMLGAGLIKLRGDAVWSFKELSALFYHYETQPVPNPLSRLLHFAPQWFHKAGVLWNHFVEVVVPWFAFFPRIFRHVAGVLMVSFQIILISSGNLSFLNWLTIIPCLACFDDSFWRKILPAWIVRRAEGRAENAPRSDVRGIITLTFAFIVAWLSIGPVKNLVSQRQAMNTSFDRLHLVNTYGAFGSVDKERFEIVFEGTADVVTDMFTEWREYDFKAKPGNPMRRPPVITPYHYRLDWETWFPWATPGLGRQGWMPHFIWKLLHNDPGTLSLLAGNPFPDQPPAYIRAVLYKYKFAPPGNADGAWWTREQVRMFIAPLSKEDPKLLQILQANGWIK